MGFGRVRFNMAEFRRLRNSAEVTAVLRAAATEDVARCNAELHAAQAARKQPVEDGYAFGVTHGSRTRIHIYPSTARGIAHEAVHHSILKNMPIGEVPAHPSPDHNIPRELGRRGSAGRRRRTP